MNSDPFIVLNINISNWHTRSFDFT